MVRVPEQGLREAAVKMYDWVMATTKFERECASEGRDANPWSLRGAQFARELLAALERPRPALPPGNMVDADGHDWDAISWPQSVGAALPAEHAPPDYLPQFVPSEKAKMAGIEAAEKAANTPIRAAYATDRPNWGGLPVAPREPSSKAIEAASDVLRMPAKSYWAVGEDMIRPPRPDVGRALRAAYAIDFGGVSSLRAPQSGPAMNAIVGTYGKGNNGYEWWVTSRVGQWCFDNEADARTVCDLLNAGAGSGAETPEGTKP